MLRWMARSTAGTISAICHFSGKTPPLSTIHGDDGPTLRLLQVQRSTMIAESKAGPWGLVIKRDYQVRQARLAQ